MGDRISSNEFEFWNSDFGFWISAHPPEKKPQITQMDADAISAGQGMQGSAFADHRVDRVITRLDACRRARSMVERIAKYRGAAEYRRVRHNAATVFNQE
jgi:hypothetical protein